MRRDPMIPLNKSWEVAAAQAEGRPVVALESTIITHGLPWPQNVETARSVEAAVRAGGAVPATIAVLGGRVHVGLSGEELEALARASDVAKLSRADLAVRLALMADGSTTVAATMICARLAGIEVFATGGIGGVHRGAETTFDVSADLDELAKTPVTVVCAGAKAILDLPKTLEALETRGVPVIGYGTDAFPAFWSRESGLPAPLRLDTPALIAKAHRLRGALGLEGGQLVVNPIPAAAEIPYAEIAPHIEAAVLAAADQGIRGKAVTPFILSAVMRATEGRSLAANAALVENNARLAAAIATALRDEPAPKAADPAASLFGGAARRPWDDD
jgi:pseudouridine-5'-phosphate glycosidase